MCTEWGLLGETGFEQWGTGPLILPIHLEPRCDLLGWTFASCQLAYNKIIQDGGLPPLGFDVTGNSAIRSADPENPTLESNMKCIGSPVAKLWPFAYQGAYGTPFCWKGRS